MTSISQRFKLYTQIVDDDAPDDVLARNARDYPAAFAVLYRRYMERVYRYLMARCGSIEDAQDLTTQTFMAALDSIGSYRAEGAFAAWLFGIARRKAAMHHRTARLHMPLDAAADIAHPDPLPDVQAAEAVQVEQMLRALPTLAPDRAEVLSLRFFAALSIEEVARLMGRSEPAVRMLMHRAIQDLRHRLPGDEDNV
jgi:RNA polymerase sigma-70 factor (ECF subfamily)